MPSVLLKSLRYYDRKGKPKEWTLDDLSLNHVNLIVGRNATGKTRTLNVIWNLAKLFVPEPKFRTDNAGYDLLFDVDGTKLRYVFCIVDGVVAQEEVYFGGTLLLDRRPGNIGEIFTETENKKVPFRPPVNELAAVARRDALQHKFLEPLHEWALAVRHYTFGTDMGKYHLVIPVKGGPELNDRNTDEVVGIFRKGIQNCEGFAQKVRDDMQEMQYDLQEVLTCPSEAVKVIQAGIPTEILALGVREKGINGIVDQGDMSQGMFRALSILIQVNYSQMANRANCILIDDIGEGLDYERSTKLIEILQRKAEVSAFQLVMTTNDRFVMNAVPLDSWSVLQRHGGHVQVRNYENSRAIFEEFKETGLSNFSFLEMDFVNGAPEEEAVAHD